MKKLIPQAGKAEHFRTVRRQSRFVWAMFPSPATAAVTGVQ